MQLLFLYRIISLFALLQGLFLIIYMIIIIRYLKGSSDAIWILPISGIVSVLIGLVGAIRPALLCLLGFEVLIIISVTLIFLEGKPMLVEPIDLIIILGNGLNDGRMSPLLQNRLNKAIEVEEYIDSKMIVVAGGTPSGQTMQSEAQIMKRYLISHGIKEDSIVSETLSNSTIENFRNISRILSTDSRILIITDRFHIARARRVAFDVGFKNISVIPARPDPILTLYYYLREIGCWILYCVRRIRNEKI